ncbi:MAG: ribonuclease D [Thermoanaerobaculia bacterium]
MSNEIGLVALLARIDAHPGAELALDTEADSFHHYFEKVCLLQLAVAGEAFLIDPLAVPAPEGEASPLAPLTARLAERPLLLHGADYDLRLLLRGYGFRAGLLFDTMIAAQLLGETEIGLAALLTKRLGIVLDKKFQRADWSERPLSPEMSAYAAADVLYLGELADSLRKDLEAKGRLDWVAEECGRLVAAPFSARESDPETDWRLKGTNALTGRERAFVRALWEAREERASELDRPPFRILTNERLLDGARAAARGELDLAKLFPGPRTLPTTFARRVTQALEQARALLPAEWPEPRRGERVEADPALEREIEKLKKKRDIKAKELALDPSVLASRAALAAVARAFLKNRGPMPAARVVEETGISGWRAEQLA